jgi:hypothetical protein
MQAKSNVLNGLVTETESIEFASAKLILNRGDTKTVVLDNIKHVHDGRSSFTFTPASDLGPNDKYSIQVYHNVIK